MKHKLRIPIFFCLLCLTCSFPAGAQSLNDTIWKGSATVKLPVLSPYRDGRLQGHPRVPSGITFTLPVEVWFLTNTEFVAVMDQRALGAASTRARLQPLIGSWRNISYGSSQNRIRTGTYNRSKLTFKATHRRLTSSSSSYAGIRTLSGSFSFPSGSRMTAQGSYITSPNPGGPSQPKYSGGVPTFTANLSKTARRPSAEAATAFSDTLGR